MSNEEWVRRALEKLDSTTENIRVDLGSMRVTLAQQHTSLEEHIRRTELLEAQVEPLAKNAAVLKGALLAAGAVAGFAVKALLHYLGL